MSSWASFFVALFALVQVWAIGLWRRFFRRGTLDIFETGRIEVGYSTLGPTLGLHGTLRAVNRDQFVQGVGLVVTRERDGARHEFPWDVFRGGQKGSEGFAVELPAGFMVSTVLPYRYNILFSDTETRRDIENLLAPVRETWVAKLAAAPPVDDDARLGLFTEYQAEPTHFTTHAELVHALYWNPGWYTLEMSVQTSRPAVPHSRNWRFELSDENVSLLKLNAISSLAFACGFNDANFNFAYPPYESSEPQLAR